MFVTHIQDSKAPEQDHKISCSEDDKSRTLKSIDMAGILVM